MGKRQFGKREFPSGPMDQFIRKPQGPADQKHQFFLTSPHPLRKPSRQLFGRVLAPAPIQRDPGSAVRKQRIQPPQFGFKKFFFVLSPFNFLAVDFKQLARNPAPYPFEVLGFRCAQPGVLSTDKRNDFNPQRNLLPSSPSKRRRLFRPVIRNLLCFGRKSKQPPDTP